MNTTLKENFLSGGPRTGKELLQSWVNKSMKIKMTDGRTLIGLFLCTDKDRNVILGSCEEYLKPPGEGGKKEERGSLDWQWCLDTTLSAYKSMYSGI